MYRIGKIRFLHEVLVRHTQLKSGCKLGSIGLSLDMNFEEKKLHKRLESFVPIYCHNYSDTVLIIDNNLVIPLCAVSVLIVNLCQSK